MRFVALFLLVTFLPHALGTSTTTTTTTTTSSNSPPSSPSSTPAPKPPSSTSLLAASKRLSNRLAMLVSQHTNDTASSLLLLKSNQLAFFETTLSTFLITFRDLLTVPFLDDVSKYAGKLQEETEMLVTVLQESAASVQTFKMEQTNMISTLIEKQKEKMAQSDGQQVGAGPDLMKKVEGTVEKMEDEMRNREKTANAGETGTLETVVKIQEEDDEDGQLLLDLEPVDNVNSLASGDAETLNSTFIKKHSTAATKIIDPDNNEYTLSKSSDPTDQKADSKLFRDVVTIISLSFSFGLVFDIFSLPPFFGYVLAGTLLGPAGLDKVKSVIQVETIAQFGAFFILFVLGLEFSLERIRKIWRVTVLGGTVIIVFTIIVTVLLGNIFNIPVNQSIFVGTTLSLSSTAVVVKCMDKYNSFLFGRLIIGLLVFQDIALGLLLAILPVLSRPGLNNFFAIAATLLLKMSCMVVISILLRKLIIYNLIKWLHFRKSHELLVLGLITTCFSFMVLSDALGLSPEVGCFVAGVVLNTLRIPLGPYLQSNMESIRDFLGSLFFAVIGLHIYPSFLLHEWNLLLSLTFFVILFKALSTWTVLSVGFKHNHYVSGVVGIGIAQVSEFGFVLASRGKKVGLLSREGYYLLLGTTSLSLLLTPFLWKLVSLVVSKRGYYFEETAWDSKSGVDSSAVGLLDHRPDASSPITFATQVHSNDHEHK